MIEADDLLALWVVYESPKDFPGEYVARRWLVQRGGAFPTDVHVRAPTLDGVRSLLPVGLFRMNRSPADEPQIVETWI